ncbi:hypothetical protein ACJIZ3_016648 [Penstemon smallii]|uniref:Autophagy-related protein 18a n=1 Tax=Penstemon smallii TaxID=265156 RepID=A0ABD3SU09_9LAMI
MYEGPACQENQDSDQSLSEEEEDLDGNWIENTISLGGPADNKGGVQVLSQLDILRDSHKLHLADRVSISSPERKTGFCVDEVENPLINDENDYTRHPRRTRACHSSEGIMYLPTMASVSHPDEEIISDDEKVSPHTHEIAEENVCGTWSEANREVDALVCLHEIVASSSSHGVSLRENKLSKGGNRTKGRPKFLFHYQSHNKDLSVVSDVNEKTPSKNFPMPDEIGAVTQGDMNKIMAESQLICNDNESEQQENIIVPSELTYKHDSKEHSMAEFLDCFQERSGLLRGSLETDVNRRGRRDKIVSVRNMFTLDRENLDDDDDDVDDLPEALGSGPTTPSDDENLLLPENPQSPKSNISKTMADQFHEALGTVSVIDERPTFAFPRPSSGLFGKLQQVMQSEKERDTLYLKNLSSETNARTCIHVRILSRSLEGKLTDLTVNYFPTIRLNLSLSSVFLIIPSVSPPMATLSSFSNPNPDSNFISPMLQPYLEQQQLQGIQPPDDETSYDAVSDRDSRDSFTTTTNNSTIPIENTYDAVSESDGRDSFTTTTNNSTITNPNPNPNRNLIKLLHVSFNQDYGCFATGTDRGFRIYNCDPFREIFRRDFDGNGGGVGAVEMLFRCNILALVGGGDAPQYPLNKVMIWDDHQSRCIGELSFRSEVRGVRLRRDRIIVILEQKIFVYNFADLKLLHQIETIANPKGLCAVSQVAGSLVLVCPGLQKGQVRVEHYASKRTKFIMAHDSRISCFTLSQDGNLLATASSKGTLVRIFNTHDGSLQQEVNSVKVGTERSSSPPDPNSSVATSSSSLYLHRWLLGLNQAFIFPGVLPKYFSSEWSVAQFRLPEGSQYIVAFGHQKNTVVILGLDGRFSTPLDIYWFFSGCCAILRGCLEVGSRVEKQERRNIGFGDSCHLRLCGLENWDFFSVFYRVFLNMLINGFFK